MRPEEFDNRLHQKLDELNPVFNEQDWIRLSKKMNASKSPMLFSKRNSIILLLLVLVLFGTWMSYRWTSTMPEYENNDGMQKEKLPTSFEIADASHSKINDNLNKPSQVQQNENGTTQLQSVNSTTSSHTNINPTKNEKSEVAITSFVKTNNAESNSISKNSTSNKRVQTKNESTTSVKSKNDNKPFVNNLTAEEKSVIAETKIQDQSLMNQFPENGISEKSNMNLDDHSLINKNSEMDNSGLAVVDPINTLSIQGLLFNDNATLGTRIKPVAGLRPYKWVIGVTGLVAASHFNTGVAFEIKTKKSISFGSGLVVQKYLEQDYLDQNEFTATNEADFTDLIRPRHSKSISFSNIKIKSMDVLLPLSLKYYFPLNTRFALFANASMQLTLYSKTSIDFQYKTQENQIFNESDFDQASNSATLINHFTFGAGLQREFKNFVFQTSFLVQKNNNNQPQITKQEMAGQISILYKL